MKVEGALRFPGLKQHETILIGFDAMKVVLQAARALLLPSND